MSEHPIGRVVGRDRTASVHVGDDAYMSVPLSGWLWQMAHSKEPERPINICSDRQLVVGVLESYLYLIQNCTRDEAWRRIKILRTALANMPVAP